MQTFRAILAAEPDGAPGHLAEVDEASLPEGDVTVKVEWSSLNYKDGLAITGTGKVVRHFPMVCGVDLAGTVLTSEADGLSPGDKVIVTGFGLGEERYGGMADVARVRSEWVVRLPPGLDCKSAMGIGTAGLTSMLCVMALERAGLSQTLAHQPVVVTGAAGGVGSVAIAILAKLGYEVTAVSGRPEQEPYLRELGATAVLDRRELSDAPPRALDKERWAAGVDAVGGAILATILRQTAYGGSVAACGLTAGADLPMTVHPFILRGVNLLGIESVRCPLPLRRQAWERLAVDLPAGQLAEMMVVTELADVPKLASEIVAGRTRGRVVVAINP